MDYARLNNGEIQFAPKRLPTQIEQDGVMVDFIVFNPTPEMLTNAGYAPVIYTDAPDDAPEGYIYVPGWDQTDEGILQTWTLEEDPYADEISAEEALGIITGGESDEES